MKSTKRKTKRNYSAMVRGKKFTTADSKRKLIYKMVESLIADDTDTANAALSQYLTQRARTLAVA